MAFTLSKLAIIYLELTLLKQNCALETIAHQGPPMKLQQPNKKIINLWCTIISNLRSSSCLLSISVQPVALGTSDHKRMPNSLYQLKSSGTNIYYRRVWILPPCLLPSIGSLQEIWDMNYQEQCLTLGLELSSVVCSFHNTLWSCAISDTSY